MRRVGVVSDVPALQMCLNSSSRFATRFDLDQFYGFRSTGI